MCGGGQRSQISCTGAADSRELPDGVLGTVLRSCSRAAGAQLPSYLSHFLPFLSLFYSFLPFEERVSLIEPGAYQLTRLADQQAPVLPQSLLSLHWGYLCASLCSACVVGTVAQVCVTGTPLAGPSLQLALGSKWTVQINARIHPVYVVCERPAPLTSDFARGKPLTLKVVKLYTFPLEFWLLDLAEEWGGRS